MLTAFFRTIFMWIAVVSSKESISILSEGIFNPKYVLKNNLVSSTAAIIPKSTRKYYHHKPRGHEQFFRRKFKFSNFLRKNMISKKLFCSNSYWKRKKLLFYNKLLPRFQVVLALLCFILTIPFAPKMLCRGQFCSLKIVVSFRAVIVRFRYSNQNLHKILPKIPGHLSFFVTFSIAFSAFVPVHLFRCVALSLALRPFNDVFTCCDLLSNYVLCHFFRALLPIVRHNQGRIKGGQRGQLLRVPC